MHAEESKTQTDQLTFLISFAIRFIWIILSLSLTWKFSNSSATWSINHNI